ncbi:MAG: type VI secretion system baseplate subunit TssG [Betaproteobacteria bacterium]
MSNEIPSATTPEITAFMQRLNEAPYRFDLWHVLRWLDAKHPGLPALGRAPRPRLEPFRIGQEASLAFAPSPIHAFDLADESGRARLTILGFGLFGPNGPLPTHLTEYVRERVRAHGDRTLMRFCDMFHHRFTLFFYRAWADVQSTASLDRPAEDRFSRYVGSLVHLGEETLRGRDAVPDHAKFFGAGHLVRETRNAEGLQRLISIFFQTGVQVEQWVCNWMKLAPEQRTRLGLGRIAERLGVGAVVGAQVLDAQGKFRLRVGPMSLAAYESHLPGAAPFQQMLAWLRNYIGIEFAWDVRLVLKRDEVPSARLGKTERLGWTTWLGHRTKATDADDLVLVHETIAARLAVAQAAPAMSAN